MNKDLAGLISESMAHRVYHATYSYTDSVCRAAAYHLLNKHYIDLSQPVNKGVRERQ